MWYRAVAHPWQQNAAAILLHRCVKMATESSNKSVQYSKYSENLSISDKRRYLEKTEDIGDPYAYPLGVLNQDDLPPVRSTDIFNYLVLSTSFCTSERFKAYKSMDAYKYFLSGFVSSVAARKVENKYVVLGQMSDNLTCTDIYTFNNKNYRIFC